MAQWFVNNIFPILSVLAAIILAVAGWKLLAYRVAQLEAWKSEHKEECIARAAQVQRDKERADAKLDELETVIQSHISNTQLHIDPNRDKAIWEEFKEGNRREFETVNRKLDKLMLIQPSP